MFYIGDPEGPVSGPFHKGGLASLAGETFNQKPGFHMRVFMGDSLTISCEGEFSTY